MLNFGEIMIICKICGLEFESHRTRQKCCSKECGKASRNLQCIALEKLPKNIEKAKIRRDLSESKVKRRSYLLMKTYHLSMESYADMLLEQDFKCKICNESFEEVTPSVDHNHITGKNRGLLCVKCNVDVRFFENMDLTKVEKYLYGDNYGT